MDKKLERISELLPCTRYDHYLAVKCIFHEDRSPSLLIYPDRYYCKSCDAHGLTSYLLRRLEGGSFRQGDYETFHPSLWRNLDEVDVESIALDGYYYLKRHPDLGYYFRNRGIPDTVSAQLLLGFLDGYYIFPILDKFRNVQGVIARAGPVLQEAKGIRYIIPPRQNLDLLYCPDWSLVETWAFVPFGIIDAISLSMAGFPAISGTVGHNLSREAFKGLRIHLIFLPDGDHKDDRLASDLACDDWRGQVLYLKYPDGMKDCNDLLRKVGLKEFKIMIDRIIQAPVIPQWSPHGSGIAFGNSVRAIAQQ
jgi:hypothetical protein